MWMKKKKKIQWGLETFGQLKKSFADLNRPTGGSFSPPVSIPQAPVSIRSHLLSIEYLFSVYYVEHSDHCNYFPFPVVLFNKAAGRISYLRIFFYTETIKQTDPVSLFLFFVPTKLTKGMSEGLLFSASSERASVSRQSFWNLSFLIPWAAQKRRRRPVWNSRQQHVPSRLANVSQCPYLSS